MICSHIEKSQSVRKVMGTRRQTRVRQLYDTVERREDANQTP